MQSSIHNTYWLIEYPTEDEKKYRVEKVEDGDGNIEAVGLLVHPWSQNTDCDEEDSFNDQKSDGLNDRNTLAKCHKYRLEENIQEHWEDEIVCSSAELNIKKSPFVQCSRIRVKDVGWVPVHRDRAPGNPNDLHCCPTKCKCHGNEVE